MKTFAQRVGHPGQGIRLIAAVAATACLLGGCTTTLERAKVDYKSQAKVGPGLEVPPDLSQWAKDSGSPLSPNPAVNASSYGFRAPPSPGSALPASTTDASTIPGTALVTPPHSASPAATPGVALNQAGEVQVLRDDRHHWLLVRRTPEQLWPQLRSFWTDMGFTLALDKPELGILETEWAENRARLPDNWLSRTLSKLADSNERDRYRVRVERTASGHSEVFITHKGLVEDFTTTAQDQLRWRARPNEPDLEMEMLRRLMMSLTAASAAQTDAAVSNPQVAPSPVRAQLTSTSGTDGVASPGLLIDHALEQAWRQVGISLDKTSFVVQDRDRSKGVYFVLYALPVAEKDKPGFFARLFGAKTNERPQQYQVVLGAEGNKTRLQIHDATGKPLAGEEALAILKVLHDELR